MYYSLIGILASFVLIIVNQDILFDAKKTFDQSAWRVYKRFLFIVLVYYVTDILWGIFESEKQIRLLFVDTQLYFVAMAIGVFFWAKYTVTYLNDQGAFGRFLIFAGYGIAGCIALLVVINFFTPVLFTIDDSCVYHALMIRYVVLAGQILLFLLTSVYAFMSMFQSQGARYYRYQILGFFGLIMASLLFVQLWFPYLPLYSIGFMLGTCMLHSFVANDEKENYKRGLEEAKKVTELKDRFVSLLDNIPGMAFTKDAQTGVYLACNQAFVEYAHKESSEMVTGLTDAQIFDAETAAHFVKADRIALSLSKPYIFFEDVPDAAGNQRQLQTTKLKYTDTAGRLCVLGMCQDITDMVRIQHEHAMTKEAYERAVSSGLMYTHIAQTLARDFIDLYYVNTETEEFIEYRRSEGSSTLSEVRRGWHFFSDCKAELAENVFEEDKEAFCAAINRKTLMKALSRKDTFSMTYRQMEADTLVYVNLKISRMEDDHYIIMGIMNVDAEVRETKARNEALAEALSSADEANKSRMSFLSGMSHELRTPINAIIGLDKLALKNDKLAAETREYLEKIGDSAGNLLSIINEVLDMSRIESGKSKLHNTEFFMNTLLDQLGDVIATQCKEKGLTYECKILNQVNASYFGDEVKIKEMLLNILSNAVKFTPAPGSVLFTVEKVAEYDHQSTLCFVIKDTGIGMDQEYLPKIFDAFSREGGVKRTKSGSSGLGLALTKRIVDMMNGSISVTSQKGVGTEFTVKITLRNSEQQNSENDLEINPEAMYVLVVDDDPIEAEHAKMVLEEVGIRADACTSGQEALRKMEIQHGKLDPYNFVLMDWNMPGMNGMETSAEIQKFYAKECTVVALSAYSWEDIQEEAQSVGVEYFIVKPLFASNVMKNFEQIARKCKLTIFKEKQLANLAGRRILLAEDIELNAEILMDSLELENIKVDHAQNGKIAVDMFEKSTAGIYAAILMDVRMPVMDGLEATKAIRSMRREDAKRIPIIALTANAFDEDVQLSMQAGMNAHLSKPVETDQLIRVLGELIYEAEKI